MRLARDRASGQSGGCATSSALRKNAASACGPSFTWPMGGSSGTAVCCRRRLTGRDEVEVGYKLARSHWGQGLGNGGGPRLPRLGLQPPVRATPDLDHRPWQRRLDPRGREERHATRDGHRVRWQDVPHLCHTARGVGGAESLMLALLPNGHSIYNATRRSQCLAP